MPKILVRRDAVDSIWRGIVGTLPSTHPSIVVFSDLDDVLLDPHLPRFATAARAIRELALDDTALVLCSGKTRAELEFVQQKLDIRQPFICENGGAVFIPEGYFSFDIPAARRRAGYQAVEFGRPYDDVVAALHRTAQRLRIQVLGFSDMSVEQVARECRLPLLQARLAKLREYEEPFRTPAASASARVRLFKALYAANFRCTSGESFDRVGASIDRHVGVDLLSSLYRYGREDITTVGVTVARPDDSLLQFVDYAIRVQDHDTVLSTIDVVDWAEAIADAVQTLRRRRTPRVSVHDGEVCSTIHVEVDIDEWTRH